MAASVTEEDLELAALRIAISASLALAVMLTNFVWFLRDEINMVWGRFRTWRVRTYLLLRYAGLASQIFNVYFTARMYAGVGTTRTGCRLWFSYQALVVQILLASVEGALMHRIYVLFRRSGCILMILVLLGAAQFASMMISAYLVVPAGQHTATCMVVKSHPGNTYFGAMTMTTSALISFMTFLRLHRLPVEWARHGVTRMMVFDTSLSSLTISGWTLFLTLCSLQIVRPRIGGNITYYWLVCTLWILIGRILMNQDTLAVREEWRTTVQLTSHIIIDDDQSDLACVDVPLP